MASTSTEEFGEDGFDPIAWINTTCANRGPDEPLDKFLAELEMRLQLNAEDLEASLQESSSQAMRRIPFAIQEIYRLQVCGKGRCGENECCPAFSVQARSSRGQSVAGPVNLRRWSCRSV